MDLPDDHLLLYRLHRGLVRVKTLALSTHDERRAPSPDLAAWLHLVFRIAYAVKPVAIAMTGFSGSGKSHVARTIAAATGASVLSTDAIRREVEGSAGDRYTPEARLANYRSMFERADAIVASGSPVILDGAFLGSEERSLAGSFATSHGIPLVFAAVGANAEVVERRLAARTAGLLPCFDSEATLNVLRAQRQAPPAPFPDGTMIVTFDTTRDGPISLDPLLRTLEALRLLVPRRA
jgi:predicted kinase